MRNLVEYINFADIVALGDRALQGDVLDIPHAPLSYSPWPLCILFMVDSIHIPKLIPQVREASNVFASTIVNKTE
jgi:hypothetical protein